MNAIEKIAEALKNAGHDVDVQEDGTLIAYLESGQTVHIMLDILPEI